jgi:hypothetical protein
MLSKTYNPSKMAQRHEHDLPSLVRFDQRPMFQNGQSAEVNRLQLGAHLQRDKLTTDQHRDTVVMKLPESPAQVLVQLKYFSLLTTTMKLTKR